MKVLKVCSLSASVATSIYVLNNFGRFNSKTVIPTGLRIVQAGQQQLELEQVQVIFRHGARTPIVTRQRLEMFENLGQVKWDKDKWTQILPWADINYMVTLHDGSDAPAAVTTATDHKKCELPGGCLVGQLTTLGQQQTYDFGKWLANEYIVKHRIISPTYKSNEIYIRTTNVPRTIQSAVCVMAGLFGKENFNESILIQTNRLEEEDLFPNYFSCAKLNKRFQRYRFHPHPVHQDEQDAINDTMGLKEGGSQLNFIFIGDIVTCRLAHGLFVPPELLDKFEIIEKCSLQMQLALLGTGSIEVYRSIEVLKNSGGSVLESLCSRINESISGKCKEKMLFYSAHDTTIIVLLSMMGVFDEQWPPFASNIILELYRNEAGERLIRVLYNGKPVILDTNSNEEFMAVEKFMDLVEAYRVLDWADDCGNTSS